MLKIKNLIFIVIFLEFFMIKNLLAITTGIFPVSETSKQYMIDHNVWSQSCPVDIERLRLVSFPFSDFNGNTQQGELIVLDTVAPYVLNIMENLYKMKFPMETVKRIETYDLKEEDTNFEGLPKEHNNTASFNCRPIKDTNTFSIHSFGLAIDINPKQNPYFIIQDPDSESVKNRKPQESHIVLVQPFEGAYYLNRSNKRPGMITHDDEVVRLFYNNGFTIWGGNWNFPLDSQHFQTTREVANLLALMNPVDAEYFFSLYVKSDILKSDKNAKDIIIEITNYYNKDAKKITSYLKNNESDFIKNPKEILKAYY